jgi:gliding motility-associated-like protein
MGCAATASVNITESPALSVSATATETNICLGESTVLNAIESGGTLPIASYNWTSVPADVSLVPTDASPTVSPLVSTVYTVEITDANGCTATADVSVNVSSAIVLSTSEDQPSSCGLPDGAISVSASGGTVSTDYAYSWNSTPAQNTASATGLTPGDYEVTVTDDFGCSETASITLTQTAGFTASISSYSDALCYQQCDGEATVVANAGNAPPLTYSWNSIPAQTSATATGLCAGTYEVTIVDAVGCQATTTVDIAEPTEVTAIATATDSSLCIGETSQLSVSGNGGTAPYSGYNWTATPADPSLVASDQNPTVSPSTSTNYQATITDANGCSANAQVSVQVLPGLTVDVIRPTANPDTAICPYDQATIDLNISGGDGNYTVFLQPDLSTPITLPISVQPNNTTTYVFEVIDGCTTPSATAQSTITINEIPTIEFSADEPNGCDIHQVQFTDYTSPTPVAWNWNFGDPDSGNNTATTPVTSHTYSGPGTFDVSLSIETAEGCLADTVISSMIEVYPLPNAQFSADPLSTTSLDPKVTFTDESSSDVVSWFWDFGTGDTSDLQNPEYMYMDTGEFISWLTVTNIFGCEATTRVGIRIAPSFTFYIPNAFTPNGDGLNETFRPYGEGVDWDTFHMSIYNRWGEEIYTTNNIEQPWDGTFKGRPVEQYVYVYSISIRAIDGRLYTYRDGFTLVR